MASTPLRRLLATALFAAPLPMAAQGIATFHAQAPVAPLVQAGMVATPSAAPVLNATRVGLSRSETAVRLDAVAEADRLNRRITKRDSQLLMIVGGAAFVAGLLIGDDVGTVFAVGGATAGLIGLYNYLK